MLSHCSWILRPSDWKMLRRLQRSSTPFAGMSVTGAGALDGLNVSHGASLTTPWMALPIPLTLRKSEWLARNALCLHTPAMARRHVPGYEARPGFSAM